jgi:glycerol-3-phosphate O-acyltransferase
MLQKTAFDVCTRINSITPLTSKSILATVLMGMPSPLTLDEIVRTARELESYAGSVNQELVHTDAESSRRALEALLRQLQRSGVAQAVEGAVPIVFDLDRAKRGALTFYRNNAIHCFMLPAVVLLSSELVRSNSGVSGIDTSRVEEVLRHAVELRNLLKFEFFFSPTSDYVGEITRALRWLEEHSQIFSGLNADYKKTPVLLRPLLTLLGDLIESYLMVCRHVMKVPPNGIERRALAQNILKEWQSDEAQEKVIFPEALSLQTFHGAILWLQNQDVLKSRTEHGREMLYYSQWSDRALSSMRLLGTAFELIRAPFM